MELPIDSIRSGDEWTGATFITFLLNSHTHSSCLTHPKSRSDQVRWSAIRQAPAGSLTPAQLTLTSSLHTWKCLRPGSGSPWHQHPPKDPAHHYPQWVRRQRRWIRQILTAKDIILPSYLPFPTPGPGQFSLDPVPFSPVTWLTWPNIICHSIHLFIRIHSAAAAKSSAFWIFIQFPSS